MARSGKTPKASDAQAFDFPLARKKELKAQNRQLVLTDSETLQYQFQRLRERINWDLLGRASTEDEVNVALSGVDQVSRDQLPNAAAILATVNDPEFPKLRPIRFLAESCALAIRTNPKNADEYSPRYSRDICYKERKRRGPPPKQMTNLEYWQAQAELGNKVPVKYLRKINRLEAKARRNLAGSEKRTKLTYVDIPDTIDSVKKRRTTVWLPELMVAKLKKLSAATGAPMAELFRRAVDAYLKNS